MCLSDGWIAVERVVVRVWCRECLLAELLCERGWKRRLLTVLEKKKGFGLERIDSAVGRSCTGRLPSGLGRKKKVWILGCWKELQLQMVLMRELAAGRKEGVRETFRRGSIK